MVGVWVVGNLTPPAAADTPLPEGRGDACSGSEKGLRTRGSTCSLGYLQGLRPEVEVWQNEEA